MPKPIILLDHHFRSASKRFITENFEHLKRLGYQKILLELNFDYPLSDFKRDIISCIETLPKHTAAYKMNQAMFALLNTIESQSMSLSCIDPESLAVAAQFQKLVSLTKSGSPERAKLIAAREAATKKRDEFMAKEIAKAVEKNDGGVIMLVGFQHLELIRLLSAGAQEYAYVLCTDSTEDTPIPMPGMLDKSLDEWLSLYDTGARTTYYSGASVSFFDLATPPSFYEIEANCRLSELSVCKHVPAVGLDLNRGLETELDYTHDEAYIVMGSKACEDKATEAALTAKIRGQFPGLSFFVTPTSTGTQVSIPAINCKEAQTIIAHASGRKM